MGKLKYRLFAGVDIKPGVVLSGLFCWVAAFDKYGKGGEAKASMVKEHLEDFDVVHVNYTPGNASYLGAIRDALGNNSDTALIANVDHAVDMWGNSDPHTMEYYLKKADFVFHVESMGARRLERLLDMDVPVIPHPVDVESVEKFKSEPDPEAQVITVQYHRYMNTWCQGWYALRRLRKTHRELRAILMGVMNDTRVPINSMFDECINRCGYENWLKLLSKAAVNIDVTPMHTYGRGVVDAAALGVPTIAGKNTEASKILWPGGETTVDDVENDYDIERIVRVLLDNEKLNSELSVIGQKNATRYGLRHSYERMVNTLETMGVVC